MDSPAPGPSSTHLAALQHDGLEDSAAAEHDDHDPNADYQTDEAAAAAAAAAGGGGSSEADLTAAAAVQMQQAILEQGGALLQGGGIDPEVLAAHIACMQQLQGLQQAGMGTADAGNVFGVQEGVQAGEGLGGGEQPVGVEAAAEEAAQQE